MAHNAAWWWNFLKRYEGIHPAMSDLEGAVADLAAAERERTEALAHLAWAEDDGRKLQARAVAAESRLAALTEAAIHIRDECENVANDDSIEGAERRAWLSVAAMARAVLAGPAPKEANTRPHDNTGDVREAKS